MATKCIYKYIIYQICMVLEKLEHAPWKCFKKGLNFTLEKVWALCSIGSGKSSDLKGSISLVLSLSIGNKIFCSVQFKFHWPSVDLGSGGSFHGSYLKTLYCFSMCNLSNTQTLFPQVWQNVQLRKYDRNFIKVIQPELTSTVCVLTKVSVKEQSECSLY